MASSKLAFVAAVAVLLLLQASSWRCAAAGDTPAVLGLISDGDVDDAACDGRSYGAGEMVAALSTKWYGSGSMCGKEIHITAKNNGKEASAKVVDHCDTTMGCKDNMITASKAVWQKLQLNTDDGEVDVTWTT